MANTLSIGVTITTEQIIEAVRKMKKDDRLAFIEDLIAAASPDYLTSVAEARSDYKHGRVSSHADVFSKK